MWKIPNIPDMTVPDGVSDADNIQIKTIVVDFDSVGETGWALAHSSNIDDIYLYFGNSEAQASTGYEDLLDLTASDFYTLDNSITDFSKSTNTYLLFIFKKPFLE